ncbi:MAG: SDR family NAD(P)-dependent oxidoreductase, partial [Arenimonas sp.]|nr:SDR family NAD(P)-dependent oxidoreductase [Arenimonas sp.]
MNTALITGASSGVAEALARELASRGWKLSLACRDVSRLDPALGHVLAADVSTEAGAQAALAAASAEFGSPPAAVVNCAGSTLIAPISRTSEAQYRTGLSANRDTALFVGKAYATALATARQCGAL